jgi:ribosomal protein L7Ae-like RNA K-turn-binding protein
MKNEQEADMRLSGLLGMARRGGKLTTGFNAVVTLIAAGKRVLVLLAADLSQKTEKELRFSSRDKQIEIIRIPLEKEEIGRALGLAKPVGVLALEDKGFASTIRTLCSHHEGESKEEFTIC